MSQPAFGPDPHRRSVAQVVGAYARGGAWVLPNVLLAQWLPAPVLKRLAMARLRSLLNFAREASPYYAEALAGLEVGALRGDDLSAVPLLDKVVLREHGERAMTRGRGGLLERRSSGSTSVPVSVYFDPLLELPRRVQELRMLTAHGFRPWHSQLILDAPTHLAPRRFAMQRLGLWQRDAWPHWLSEEESVEWVRERQPDFIVGVLSGVRMLALSAERHGGLGYQPMGIFTKGELLDASSRWFLERVFRAPVVDFYATEETGIIAWECPARTGYHVDADMVHVEILREDGRAADPDEIGEVVVTNLYQRAMPMIRFRTGDLGVIAGEPCRCGRGLPLLRELRGRRLDCIVTPAGELHDPFRVVSVMETVAAVRWFRIEQDEPARLRVDVTWDSEIDPDERVAAEAEVRAGLLERLGDTIAIDVLEVEMPELQIGAKHPVIRGLPGAELEALVGSDLRFRV